MEEIKDFKDTGENILIRRGRVDSITVYEVTDYELGQLENGSPASLFLNFAILLLTTGISFLIALLTTTIESDRIFYVFVIVTLISFISGIVLFILWLKGKKSIKLLIEKVRNRCI